MSLGERNERHISIWMRNVRRLQDANDSHCEEFLNLHMDGHEIDVRKQRAYMD